MSISSEITRISSEVNTQADLIQQIKSALNGKVAGGEPTEPSLQSKTVTPTKSVQNVTPDIGYDGLEKVTVNAIPNEYIVPSGTKNVTSNGTHDVNIYKNVEVNVPIPDGYIKPSGTKSVTSNGTHDVKSYESVSVNVPAPTIKLQEKTATVNGVVTPDSGYDGLSKVTVNVASSGGDGGSSEPFEEPAEKDINFYDYDGTRLYSYTVAEMKALTSMPSLPTHPGLICQGWNYTLEELQTYNRYIDIGANYTTYDGKTRIYIRLEEGRTSPMLGVCPKGTVTVDWGDGSANDVLTGNNVNTEVWTPVHNYPSGGSYVITLTVEGSMYFKGNSTNNSGGFILRYSTSTDPLNSIYQNSIWKIEIGENVGLGIYSFPRFYSLEKISIPTNIITILTGICHTCTNLKCLVLPRGMTGVPANIATNAYAVKRVIAPHTVTTMGASAFNNVYALGKAILPDNIVTLQASMFANSLVSHLFIPKGVTDIPASAFANMKHIKYFDFSTHESVPVLANTNAFTSIPTDCEIRIPTTLYDEWVAATNWSTYASKIVAV